MYFSDVQSDPTYDDVQSIGQVLTEPEDPDVRVWELNRKQAIEQQQLVRTENNPLVPGSRPSFFAQTDFFRELIT